VIFCTTPSGFRNFNVSIRYNNIIREADPSRILKREITPKISILKTL
jgi:hypothetical protein